eukprot:TRINITY_DN12079_c0_g1_i1.p2 TRINITY_DN12079_c0_g1~~TRINITY_DN12079_c0_g1_i1.p2  ORF type:complete len:105 (+),score=31.31 TRINITY_DN12079_c0_g1_i1:65-379(+)
MCIRDRSKPKPKLFQNPRKRSLHEHPEDKPADAKTKIDRIDAPKEKFVQHFEFEDRSMQFFPSTNEELDNDSDLDFDMEHEVIRPLELESNKHSLGHWGSGEGS